MLARGPWAAIPVLGISWSRIGVVWFAQLLTLILLSNRSDWALRAARVAARIGVAASFGFVALMVALRTPCAWCLLIHAASVICWGAVEVFGRHPSGRGFAPPLTMSRGAGSFWRAGMSVWLLVFTVIVATTAVFDARAVMLRRRAADEAAGAVRTAIRDGTMSATVGVGETNVAAEPRLRGRHRIGAPSARIEVVVFSDYQCPDCQRIERELESLVERGDIGLTVKHFPLCADCNRLLSTSLHPDACRRAAIAEAAGQLGGASAFSAAHQTLFRDAASPLDPVDAVSQSTGIDRSRLIEAMLAPATRESIARDIEDAVALGVTFTPMVFVNGREWKWYLTRAPLADLVREATFGQTSTPPPAADKLVEDWRCVPLMRAFGSAAPRGFVRIEPTSGRDDVPELVLWVDYRTPGTATIDSELAALASEGLEFRLRIMQFPVSSACNTTRGIGAGSPESCLAALIANAAGLAAGDAGFRAVHAWLIAHTDQISLEGLAPTLDTLPGGRAATLASFGDGTAMTLTQQQVSVLADRIAVQMVPTLVIDGRPVPRWDHPGANRKVVLRKLVEAATAARTQAPVVSP